MIPLVKAIHIAALLLWCAGLIALPLMLARHAPDQAQSEYARLRRYTHYTYTRLVTPAAVIAVSAGTALLFLREAFVPWMFAKLVGVALLVVLHARVGHVTLVMGEEPGEHPSPRGLPLVIASLAVMTAVLFLVLAKPAVPGHSLPEWLLSPRDRQLPLDEVPS